MSNVMRILLPTLVSVGLTMIIIPAAWALLRERMRTSFAAKDKLFTDDDEPRWASVGDLNGLGKKLDAVQVTAQSALDVAEDTRGGLRALERDHANATMRISEVVVEPMREITAQLRGISERQAEHGAELGRQGEALKGLGRSLDDLREEVRSETGKRKRA